MAISIDGLITRGESDSDWVLKADWDQFYSYIKASDVSDTLNFNAQITTQRAYLLYFLYATSIGYRTS